MSKITDLVVPVRVTIPRRTIDCMKAQPKETLEKLRTLAQKRVAISIARAAREQALVETLTRVIHGAIIL